MNKRPSRTKPAPGLTGYFVSSTHWDREWWEPFQHYRFRLVEALDRLLDLMERQKRFRYFQLDGQAVLTEDYLEIKPEQRPRLAKLARAGRIQIGPWYVMPDEFLPCGESLVRNLLRGHQVAGEFTSPMKVGFVCDIFGHNSQLPQILRGFGIDAAVIWRGANFPKHPGLFRWQAADGSEVLTFAFSRDGYGLYHWNLRRKVTDPAGRFDIDKALPILDSLIEEDRERVPGSALLIFDGIDHARPEPATVEFIERARRPDLELIHSTLEQFFAAVRRQKLPLKEFRGELRDAPERETNNLLPGVLSSRIHLKQQNALCENRLLFWAEPFSVFAHWLGEPYPAGFLRTAWKYLLRNHPHDSMCGCSIDQVHQDMLYRFDQCRLIAERAGRMSLRAIVDRLRLPKLQGPEDKAVTVFNPGAQAIDGVVEVPLLFPCNTQNRFLNWFGWEKTIGFHLYDASGQELACQRLDETKQVAQKNYDRVADFQGDIYEQVRVALPLQIPAFGWTTVICKPCKQRTGSGGSQLVDDHTMQNEHLRVVIQPNGTLDITDRRTGQTYRNGLTFEEQADAGDGWFHGPPINNEIFTSHGAQADVALLHDGFAQTTFRLRVVMHVPRRWEHDEKIMRRSGDLIALQITSWLTLRAGAPYLELRTEVENTVEDHRLRVLFPTHIAADTYVADSPYDVVTRNVALRPDWYKLHEPEVETKPQYTFTAVNDGQRGLAVISVGQPESTVRDLPERPIALTLLRGFKRTAGTPGEPGGQILGHTTHRYWIYPHAGPLPVSELCRLGQRLGAGLEYVYTTRERQQANQLAPTLGPTGGWLTPEAGPLLVTAIKQSEDSQALILRGFNPTDELARQRFTFYAEIKTAHRADLLERPREKLSANGRRVEIAVRPKEIFTLRIKLAPLGRRSARRVPRRKSAPRTRPANPRRKSEPRP
jgi:hypothetical protein